MNCMKSKRQTATTTNLNRTIYRTSILAVIKQAAFSCRDFIGHVLTDREIEAMVILL